MRKNIPINFHLLKNALVQSGPFQNQTIPNDKDWLFEVLKNKIQSTDFQKAQADVENFLKSNDRKFIQNWSQELFLSQINEMAFFKNT